ncbi:uncharacterized protein LOC105683118 [Athalia rosae]|uniref:uncharacterized protein LOC105683118 n=1 Tax=Athalia rosae TaxID=37344 RepID=UPI0020336B9A|nr:uncharacterized protein LOC105683118 [Athalia rosae]XP_020706387.2 uncharacterized protein LOC105683118 [Athalia rosae]
MLRKELLLFAILLISLIHRTDCQTLTNRNPAQAVSHDTTNAEYNSDAANFQTGGTQGAKAVRKARAVVGNAIVDLMQLPFSLLSRLFGLIRLPFSLITNITPLYTNLLGGWVFTVPVKLLEFIFSNLWNMTKRFVLPTLDDVCMKLTNTDSISDDMKTTLNSAHTAYTWMKRFGFLRPV